MGGWNAHNFRPPPPPNDFFSCNPPPPHNDFFFHLTPPPPPPMIFITFSKPHTQCVFLNTTRKRPICENARIEYARYFLLFTTLYFFFFSSSFLFFSFLVLLASYVHSRVSRSVVSGVHFFLAGLYSDSHENTPESWIWPPWIHFTRVGTRYVTFKH